MTHNDSEIWLWLWLFPVQQRRWLFFWNFVLGTNNQRFYATSPQHKQLLYHSVCHKRETNAFIMSAKQAFVNIPFDSYTVSIWYQWDTEKLYGSTAVPCSNPNGQLSTIFVFQTDKNGTNREHVHDPTVIPLRGATIFRIALGLRLPELHRLVTPSSRTYRVLGKQRSFVRCRNFRVLEIIPPPSRCAVTQ